MALSVPPPLADGARGLGLDGQRLLSFQAILARRLSRPRAKIWQLAWGSWARSGLDDVQLELAVTLAEVDHTAVVPTLEAGVHDVAAWPQLGEAADPSTVTPRAVMLIRRASELDGPFDGGRRVMMGIRAPRRSSSTHSCTPASSAKPQISLGSARRQRWRAQFDEHPGDRAAGLGHHHAGDRGVGDQRQLDAARQVANAAV